MLRAFALGLLLALLSACSRSHGIDSAAASAALVQRMSTDGYRYAEVMDDPVFKSDRGRTEMRCTVRYITSQQRAGSAAVLAMFRSDDTGLRLDTYSLDAGDAFRARVDEPAQ